MKKVTSSLQFKLSIISSLLLLFSIMYGQKLLSELWMLFGFLQLGLIAFFVVELIKGIIFWVKQKSAYTLPYIPFLTSTAFLILIIILPLNWIRSWMGFELQHKNYELAADLAMKGKVDSMAMFDLPDRYKSLSINDGKVWVVTKANSKAVFFYTFTGIPDGMQGFVKVSKGKAIDYFIDDITGRVYEIKNLGNGWYYVVGK